MTLLTRWMDWLCRLFACGAEDDLRINRLIMHLPSDTDDL